MVSWLMGDLITQTGKLSPDGAGVRSFRFLSREIRHQNDV